MDGLALGASLAILFRSAKWKVCQRLALLVLVVNVAVVVSICVTRNTTVHDDTWIRTAGFSAIVFASGALLVLALGPLQRVLSVHILRLFGKYSYGLYLYHLPLTGVLVRLKPWFAQGAFGSVLYVAAALLINLCVAALSFHLFEQPILKFKDRFSYRSTQKSLPETLRPEVNIGQAADWATLEATQPITNLTALHPRVASASKPDARSA
jgi:peptidoglycan/LPS O-acetylase OafA/YrhL